MRVAGVALVAALALGAGGCDGGSGTSGPPPPVILRERPAATLEVTLKALGVT